MPRNSLPIACGEPMESHWTKLVKPLGLYPDPTSGFKYLTGQVFFMHRLATSFTRAKGVCVQVFAQALTSAKTLFCSFSTPPNNVASKLI